VYVAVGKTVSVNYKTTKKNMSRMNKKKDCGQTKTTEHRNTDKTASVKGELLP
jgi:hypothetical protein